MIQRCSELKIPFPGGCWMGWNQPTTSLFLQQESCFNLEVTIYPSTVHYEVSPDVYNPLQLLNKWFTKHLIVKNFSRSRQNPTLPPSCTGKKMVGKNSPDFSESSWAEISLEGTAGLHLRDSGLLSEALNTWFKATQVKHVGVKEKFPCVQEGKCLAARSQVPRRHSNVVLNEVIAAFYSSLKMNDDTTLKSKHCLTHKDLSGSERLASAMQDCVFRAPAFMKVNHYNIYDRQERNDNKTSAQLSNQVA